MVKQLSVRTPGQGTWQGIDLWEHRRRGGERGLLVHIAA
jgi:thiamine phosphate synthase YjbQ (UPF0047 family)